MSASEHLNPNQLCLFMQARELMDVPTPEWGDGNDDYRTMRQDVDLYHGKLEESKHGYEHDTFRNLKYDSKVRGKRNLYESIQREGVKSPVTLSHSGGLTSIDDGHHRIAAANDIDPEMYISVRYRN